MSGGTQGEWALLQGGVECGFSFEPGALWKLTAGDNVLNTCWEATAWQALYGGRPGGRSGCLRARGAEDTFGRHRLARVTVL